MKENVTDLVSQISGKQIILVGENHGVIENAEFLQQLVSEMSIDVVALEYPKSETEMFLQAIKENDFKKMAESEWGQILINDGKFSEQHFAFLRFLFEKDIQIVFFDADGDWDDRDKRMFENLKPYVSVEGTLLIVSGNIHTKLEPFRLMHLDSVTGYTPMGSYVPKENLVNIELKYDSGEFFNKKKRKFETNEEPQEIVQKITDITYHFHIPVAHSTQ